MIETESEPTTEDIAAAAFTLGMMYTNDVVVPQIAAGADPQNEEAAMLAYVESIAARDFTPLPGAGDLALDLQAEGASESEAADLEADRRKSVRIFAAAAQHLANWLRE